MTRQKKTFGQRSWEGFVLIVVLPLVVPLALVVLIGFVLYRGLLHILVVTVWLPRGKNVLVVTSDSPLWQDYMSNEIMPLLQSRAVVLNWSNRRNWATGSLAVRLFRAFGGTREFNPMVIIFRPLRRARVFRLWSAFKEQQRSDTEPIAQLRRDLMLAL